MNKERIREFKVESDDFITKNSGRIYKYEKTFYKNKDCNNYQYLTNYKNHGGYDEEISDEQEVEQFKFGFLLRSVLCLCMMAAFIICGFSNSKSAGEVFSQITEEIGANTSPADAKDEFALFIKKLLE